MAFISQGLWKTNSLSMFRKFWWINLITMKRVLRYGELQYPNMRYFCFIRMMICSHHHHLTLLVAVWYAIIFLFLINMNTLTLWLLAFLVFCRGLSMVWEMRAAIFVTTMNLGIYGIGFLGLHLRWENYVVIFSFPSYFSISLSDDILCCWFLTVGCQHSSK